MPIGYVDAPDVKRRVDGIIERLGLSYIKKDCAFVVRSRGSSSLHAVARIHGLGRIWHLTNFNLRKDDICSMCTYARS